MVSVGTQTPWSWLVSLSGSAEDEGQGSENEGVPITVSGGAVETPKGGLQLPEIATSSREAKEEPRETVEQLSLPQIESGGDGSGSRRLAALELAGDSDSASLSDDDRSEVLPPLPAVPGLRQVSWPAVLRYLRESESEASRYFSLDRYPRPTTQGEMERDQQTWREVRHRELSKRGETEHSEDVGNKEPIVEGEVCHFCGQPTGQWSMLETAMGTGNKVPEACCWQFKEYCFLVAESLQQMIAERVLARPTEISVRLQSKKDAKAAAEERALALVRRRKRWEEQQKRKLAKKTLQSSSFYSLTKQTKTIQFSLTSPAVMSTGWTTGERQRGSVGSQKKRKKKAVTRKLPPDILDLLRKTVPVPREVEVREYPDTGSPLCTLLPDHTGQFFYPSGSVAVLIYSHSPGLLSYLLFNERGEEVLGYADQLGRVWCRHPPPESGLRLWLTAGGEGLVYSVTGVEVKRWGRDTETGQPLVFPLNQHLTLQLPRKSEAVITFSANQQLVKFVVPHKLKEKSEILARERQPDSSDDYHCYLSQAKARLKYLLPAPATGKRQRAPRARSRSTGALTFPSHLSPCSRPI